MRLKLVIWWAACVLVLVLAASPAHAQQGAELMDAAAGTGAGEEPSAIAAAADDAEGADLEPVVSHDTGDDTAGEPVVAQLVQPSDAAKPIPKPTQITDDEEDEGIEEYDPWQSFNEKTFEINRKLDEWVLKPVAKAYDKIVPDLVQRSLRNAFDNVGSVRRIVNGVAQGRFETAGQELGRFVFNTVFGIGGLFDVARGELGIESKSIDAGQTFGVYGAPPGPYLVIPLLPPFTIREAVGFVVDSFLNPLRYINLDLPISIAIEAGKMINERSLNLETFEELEADVFDLYTAVRNGYLQRRVRMIEEGRAESVFFGKKKAK